MAESAKQQKIKSETGQNHGNSSSFTPDDDISQKKKKKIKHETDEYHGNPLSTTPDNVTSKKEKKKIKSETGERHGNVSSPTLDDTASKKKKKKPREEHAKVEEERSSKKKKKRKHKDPEDKDIGASTEVDKEGFESSCAESYSKKKKKKHKNKKKTGLEETAGTAEAEYSSKLKEAIDTEEVAKSGDPEDLEADVYSHVRKKIKKSRELDVREGSDERKDSTNVSEKQEEKKRKKKAIRSGFGDSKGTENSQDRATEEENNILTKGQRGTYVPSSEEKIPVSHNKKKRVSFSDVIEILGENSEKKSLQDAALHKAISLGWRHQDENPEPLRGKRFTPEEDQAVRLSVALYVMEKGYDMKEGIHKVMNDNLSKDFRHCWREIASGIPWRPVDSIRYRAHVLYERSAERGWTQDEIEALKRLQSIHGNKWKFIGDILGKSRIHVKDTWRRFKRENLARGSPWTQEEYSRLFHLVSKCLRLKNQLGEEQPTFRTRRDNLNWEAIADCMGTRDHADCCRKWYYDIASPMIKAGEWANEDDYTLVKSLGETGASDAEAVDWNGLVAGRSGDTCRKRWSQMVKHLGEQRKKPFPEQLEIIARRYAPDLIE